MKRNDILDYNKIGCLSEYYVDSEVIHSSFYGDKIEAFVVKVTKDYGRQLVLSNEKLEWEEFENMLKFIVPIEVYEEVLECKKDYDNRDEREDEKYWIQHMQEIACDEYYENY